MSSNYKLYISACSKGKISIVKSLINKVDITKNKHEGFMSACMAGHVDIVKLHLDKVDITMYKCEPFVQACWYNHLQLAKLFYTLDKTDKTHKVISSGAPLVGTITGHYTAKTNAYKTMIWLLNNFGPDSDNKLINKKYVVELLYNCAERGVLKGLIYLDKRYKLINKTNSEIIVKLACRNYRVSIIKYLKMRIGKELKLPKESRTFLESESNNSDAKKILNLF